MASYAQENYYEFSHEVLNNLSNSRAQLIDESFILCSRSKEFLNSDFFYRNFERDKN